MIKQLTDKEFVMKKIFALLVMAILPMIAGCGSGGGGGSDAPTAAVFKLSSDSFPAGAGAKIYGIHATIDLPTGVTVKADAAGNVDTTDKTGTVYASGLLNNTNSSPLAVYTPAVGATKAKLTIDIGVGGGVAAGEYATINVILDGVNHPIADYTVSSHLDDNLGNPIDGTSVKIAVK